MMDVKLVLMTSLKHTIFPFREKIDFEGGRKGATMKRGDVVYFILTSQLLGNPQQKMQLHHFPSLKREGERRRIPPHFIPPSSLFFPPCAVFVCSVGVDRTLMMDCSGGPPERMHVKKRNGCSVLMPLSFSPPPPFFSNILLASSFSRISSFFA